MKWVLACAVLVFVTGRPLPAAEPEFTKVFDTSDAIPGGVGRFATFNADPNIDGDSVAFIGRDAASSLGVYLADLSPAGGVSVVADRSTLRPGSGNPFTFFSNTSVSGRNVSFLAQSEGYFGVYSRAGGSLRSIADNHTPAPGASGFTFKGFSGTSIDTDLVSFHSSHGDTFDRGGVYRGNGGPLQVIADTRTSAPGGGAFTSINTEVSAGGGGVAFQASTSTGSGVFKHLGGELRRVADINTVAPGSDLKFAGLDNAAVSFDGQNMAFLATRQDGVEGLYAERGATLRRVADETMPAPGTVGLFRLSRNFLPSIDAGHVAFLAGNSASADTTLYLSDIHGSLITVVREGDTLFGKQIADLGTSEEALSGNRVVFFARFTDGSSGIFTATVPEPSITMVIALAGLLIRRRRRSAMAETSL